MQFLLPRFEGKDTKLKFRAFTWLFVFLLFSSVCHSLELKNLRGETESLADYRGKVIVLNFWATWCVPCREEMPLFVRMQEEYGSRGVQFIAASTDTEETRDEIAPFVREHRIQFPVWVDATPQQQASFRLGTDLPATAILDKNGVPVFRIIGASTRRALAERLEYLLGQRASMPPELLLPPGITEEHFREAHERGGSHEHEHMMAMAHGSEVPS